MKLPVFVYGTLRRGATHHFHMAGATWLGAAWLPGSIYRCEWYPVYVPAQSGVVIGELYQVEDDHLARLDQFEGFDPLVPHASSYRRVVAQATLSESGKQVSAWVWAWQDSLEHVTPIASGDWLQVDLSELR